MSIADWVLQKSLDTTGISHLLWNRVRHLLVRIFNDPPCLATAHGRSLRLPLSHELPTYLKLLPFYDRLPERLGSYLHNTYGRVKCLDIGANVGDTLAALYRSENDLFLAVEPEIKFNYYLHENWDVPNVKILDVVCAANTARLRFEIIEKFGTASFRGSSRGTDCQTMTVDDLVKENPEFVGTNLIKIDTDGQDFEVIAGAKQTLLGQPAILFESDVFGNVHYVEECLDTLAAFRIAGYQSMLVYDKFGYPLGRHMLQKLTHFRDLLLYQLTKKYMYYDILLMKEQDIRAFHALETSYFVNSVPDLEWPTADRWPA